jgi:hypothetical protein
MGRVPSFALVVAGLTGASAFSLGCGSNTGSHERESSGGTGGSHPTGGSNDFAVGGSGGSGSIVAEPGGTNAGGGSSSLGGGSLGGSSAGSASGCRTGSDCQQSNLGGPIPSVTQCLAPGQAPPPASCGAAGWCGQCNCGPQPQAPLGYGMPCLTSSDCPAADANVSTAAVCDGGSCTQCATAADCPAMAPVCGSVRPGVAQPFRLCLECLTDLDCPSEKPRCIESGGVSKCLACASDSDCATGACSSGTCVPGCSAQTPCSSPLTSCGATQRCEWLACQNDAACPANASCQQGHCARRACATDTDCDSGGCVNSVCYETLGTCYTQTFPP